MLLIDLQRPVVLSQLVTSATGNQQVNSNDLNSLIQGVRLTQVRP